MKTKDEALTDAGLNILEQQYEPLDKFEEALKHVSNIVHGQDEPEEAKYLRTWYNVNRKRRPTEAREALDEFKEKGTDGNFFRAVEAALRQADAPRLEVRQLALVKEPLPEAVLWREGENKKDGAILSAGDVCILSGAGGVGKSTLALQLAISAAGAEYESAHVCGLSVRKGPVLYASYEDVPAVMFHRGQRICGELENEQKRKKGIPAVMFHRGQRICGELENEQKRKKGIPAVMFHRGQRICGELENEQKRKKGIPAVMFHRGQRICGELENEQKRKKGIPADVHLAGMFGRPIYGPPNGSANDVPAPLDAFRELFDAARTIQPKPSLIVIDPAAAAFSSPKAGVEWVRLFLDALRIEAAEIGCGILLVAHSTKAARNARETGDPGSVAGSAGWYDAARGVIILHETTNGGEGPRLEIMKANYGLRGNPIKLERSENGVWKRPDTKFDNNDAPEEKDIYAPENAPF